MNRKSLLAIERIIACINELEILTKDKEAEYFYDSLEMNILIDLISEIEVNLSRVNRNIKDKYKHINWNLIQNAKKYDEVFGGSFNLGEVWKLASITLKSELLDDLEMLLTQEIPKFYKSLCEQKN